MAPPVIALHARAAADGLCSLGATSLYTWLVSLSPRDANMERILWTALTRIALMTSLIPVMALPCLMPERSRSPPNGR